MSRIKADRLGLLQNIHALGREVQIIDLKIPVLSQQKQVINTKCGVYLLRSQFNAEIPYPNIYSCIQSYSTGYF